MVSLQQKIILLSLSRYENMSKNYSLLLKRTLQVQTKACIIIHKTTQLKIIFYSQGNFFRSFRQHLSSLQRTNSLGIQG